MVFARVSGDTMSHDEELDVLCYAPLAAVSVVSTIPSIAIVGPRSETSSQSTGIFIPEAHRRSSTPLGMHGFIHQPGTIVSSSGILYRCAPLIPPLLALLGWTIPILILLSSILHSCWALIPGERPRAFSVTFSLVNFPRSLPFSFSPAVCVAFSCSSFLSLIRSLRSESTSYTLDPFSPFRAKIISRFISGE